MADDAQHVADQTLWHLLTQGHPLDPLIAQSRATREQVQEKHEELLDVFRRDMAKLGARMEADAFRFMGALEDLVHETDPASHAALGERAAQDARVEAALFRTADPDDAAAHDERQWMEFE